MTSDPTDRLADGLADTLAALEAVFPADATRRPLQEQRALYTELSRRFDLGRPADVAVEDTTVPGPAGPIPVRSYRPAESTTEAALLYFHGGGWVFGNLDSHDGIVATLSHRAGVPIIAVDYRLAPEHRFPAAVEDARAALAALREAPARFALVETPKILVGGDSAGGNLAAVLALQDSTDGLLAIYPAFDFSFDSASCREFANAPALTLTDMIYFRDSYLGPDADPADPLAAPLEAPDFGGLPPSVLHAAAIDPLRDDAITFAERARRAQVPIRSERMEGLVHGYLRLAGHVPAADQALSQAAADLRWLAGLPPHSTPSETSSSRRLERQPGVDVTELDGELFLVPANDSEIFYLDSMGAALWRLLETPHSPDEVRGVFAEAFPDVSTGQLQRDMNGAMKKLLRSRLIRWQQT